MIFFSRRLLLQLCMALSLANPVLGGMACRERVPPPEESSIQQKITTPTVALPDDTSIENETPSTDLPSQTPTKPENQIPSTLPVTPTIPAQPAPETLPLNSSPDSITDEPKPTPVENFQPSIVHRKNNIEIILDASGSMSGMIENVSKIEIVKSTLHALLAEPLPNDIERLLGIRAFGNRHPLADNNCQDSELVLPISPMTLDTVSRSMEKLTPKGKSPIAFSILQAEGDFTASAGDTDNLVILIADGSDNCDMDACKAASIIRDSAKQIQVHVIAFDTDQRTTDQLKCIAKESDGQFFLARNEVELRNALDQAMNSMIPYNLKLRAVAGASPLDTTMTVYRSSDQSIVQTDETSGIKFYSLPPSSYDILIEYSGSPEKTKPRKLIKGVEIQSSTKAEQIVQFKLGNIHLKATDENGEPTITDYRVVKSGTNTVVAEFTGGPEAATYSFTPGVYDIQAIQVNPEGLSLTNVIPKITINEGETTEQHFKFQAAKLFVKAQITPKEFIPFHYMITKADDESVIYLKGDSDAVGVTLELPSDRYDLYVMPKNSEFLEGERIKVDTLNVLGGESYQRLASFITGTIVLSGKDSRERAVLTEYSIRKAGTNEEVVKTKSSDDPKRVYITPGTYDVTAVNVGSRLSPPPTILWTEVEVEKNKSIERQAIFAIGELRLIGKNSKEQRISTSFTVFRSGTTDEVATLESKNDWVSFYLTPGMYAIRATNIMSKTEPKPTTWLHDVMIEKGDSISKEAIFTSGKIKLMCRGENNEVLECTYRLYEYGSDPALFSGTTTRENWREYDISPGRYYLEAGWLNEGAHQKLKKWINVSVHENEVVEMVIKF